MPRFVILLHDCPPGYQRPTHWDFMLERGAALRTWALEREPGSAVEIAAEALPDHRLAYLDYEGPVSGDRGTVTQWDAGRCEIEHECDAEWIVRIAGQKLVGRVTLVRPSGTAHSWRFSFSPERSATSGESGASWRKESNEGPSR